MRYPFTHLRAGTIFLLGDKNSGMISYFRVRDLGGLRRIQAKSRPLRAE